MLQTLLFLQASADCNICDLLPKCAASLNIAADVLIAARLTTAARIAAQASISTAIGLHVLTPCAGTQPMLKEDDNCCPSCNPAAFPWDAIRACGVNRTEEIISRCPLPSTNCVNGMITWADGCPTCIPIPMLPMNCTMDSLPTCDGFHPFALDLMGCPVCRPPPPCADGTLATCRASIAGGSITACASGVSPVLSNCCVSCTTPAPTTTPCTQTLQQCLASRPECTQDSLDLQTLLTPSSACCYGCRRPETRWPAIQVALCKSNLVRCAANAIWQTAPGNMCGTCNDIPLPCNNSCTANQVCVNTGNGNAATCKNTAKYTWHVVTGEIEARAEVTSAFVAELVARVFEDPAYVKLVAYKQAIIQGLATTAVKTAAGVQIQITAPSFTADASASMSAGRRLLSTSSTDEVMAGAAGQSPYNTTNTPQTAGAAQVGAVVSVVLAFIAAFLF